MSAPRSVSWFDGYRFAPPILRATDGVTGGFEKAHQVTADCAFGSNPPYKIRILIAPSADDDFADLDHRAQIGIVRNVAHESCLAMALSLAWLCRDRSVPRGRYWRSNLLVFSFEPRCQGDRGSQK